MTGKVLLRGAAAIVLLAGFSPTYGDETPDLYLSTLRRYADTMIEKGRDRYGKVHSPLFASALDIKTLRLPELPVAKVKGTRGQDRCVTGGNPMHDANLYRLLYALTEVTGDGKYAKAADEALEWFFKNCQSEATGLLAWGEHLGWSFEKERPEGPAYDSDNHEYEGPWPLWERSFALAPEPCLKFAKGVWDHQIADQKTGNFSRHARYSKHGPEKNSEFTRHGGFYIATWAEAYKRSKDPVFLKAIEVLLNNFERRRHPESGAIPSRTARHPELFWTSSNLSLAIDLWDAADRVPSELAERMKDCASRTDEVYLKIPHDLGAEGKGFIDTAATATLERGDGKTQPDPSAYFTLLWPRGYQSGDAGQAMHCYERYRQARLDGFKKLFLASAERYFKSELDPSILMEGHPLRPGVMAAIISVMLRAHRVTGEKRFLDKADRLGRTSVEYYWKDSPVPRASARHEHYETETGGGTLALVLLELWSQRARPDKPLEFAWIDR